MASDREAVKAAMLKVVNSKGYQDSSLEAILDEAGVSREQFDRLFASKEECAFALFNEAVSDYEEAVRAGFESEPSWPDSLRSAAYAAAGWWVDHPEELRFGTVEMMWAGEEAQARRETAFQGLVELVDAGREVADDPDSISPYTAEGVIGSIAETLTRRLQHEEMDLFAIVPEMMYLAVLPYLGEEAARKELAIARPPRPARR